MYNTTDSVWEVTWGRAGDGQGGTILSEFDTYDDALEFTQQLPPDMWFHIQEYS